MLSNFSLHGGDDDDNYSDYYNTHYNNDDNNDDYNNYYNNNDGETQELYEKLEMSGCLYAMEEEMKEIFRPFHDDHDEANMYVGDVYEIDGVGVVIEYEFRSAAGAINATGADDYLATFQSEVAAGLHDELLHNGDHASTCLVDVNATLAVLMNDTTAAQVCDEDDDEGCPAVGDLPLDIVPAEFRWLEPYGSGGLMADVGGVVGASGLQVPVLQLHARRAALRRMQQRDRCGLPDDAVGRTVRVAERRHAVRHGRGNELRVA